MPNNPWEPQGSYYNPQTGKYETPLRSPADFLAGNRGGNGGVTVVRSDTKSLNSRIDQSEADYQAAQAYYRQKAEEMQGREAPQMDWLQAQADYAAYQQDRARQQSFADTLQAQAEGRGGPSVAEMQMQAGLAAGQQQARAQAASARGGALAQAASNRLAMQQAGNMAGQVNQQAGVLRAQEQAQARQEYAQALAQMQSQNAQQRGLSQGQTVATAQNEAGQRQRNDAMAGAMYGQESGARDNLFQGRVEQQGMAMGLINANRQAKAASQARSDQNKSALLGTAATIGTAALMFSDVRAKTGIEPAVPGWDPNKWASGSTGIEPVQPASTGMNRGEKMQALGMAGQLGSQLGTIFSDERGKSLQGAAGSELAEQMREAPPYRYRYKDPADGAGERFGPMAQDLAQTESGRSVVVETPRGLAIDGQRAIPNLLAQTATLQRQLDEMRAKFESRKGGK